MPPPLVASRRAARNAVRREPVHAAANRKAKAASAAPATTQGQTRREGRRAERPVGGDRHPVEQRRLVEEAQPVLPGRHEVARARHVEGDARVAALVGVPEVAHARERAEQDERREEGERDVAAAGGRVGRGRRERGVERHVGRWSRGGPRAGSEIPERGRARLCCPGSASGEWRNGRRRGLKSPRASCPLEGSTPSSPTPRRAASPTWCEGCSRSSPSPGASLGAGRSGTAPDPASSRARHGPGSPAARGAPRAPQVPSPGVGRFPPVRNSQGASWPSRSTSATARCETTSRRPSVWRRSSWAR